MSTMTERLKKTAEDTTRIHSENYPPVMPGNTPTETVTAPAPTPGSPTPGTSPQPPASTTPTPTATPPGPTPPTPPPATPTPPPEVDWKHKFEVLEGKYRKEIGEANTLVARAMTEIADLKVEVSTLKTKTAPPPQTPSAPTALKPEEMATIESFKREYPDMMKDGFEPMVRMICAQLINEALKDFLPQLKKLDKVDQLEQRFASKETGDFNSNLARLVPDWAEINNSPEFHGYLRTHKEKYTGASFWDLIGAAANRGDVQAVADIINDYKALNGNGSPNANPNPSPPPTPPATVSASNLPPNLAPPKPSGGYPAVEGHIQAPDNNKRIFTPDQVRSFYADMVKGIYKGKEAEAKAMEAEINLASREGRIRA